MAEHATSHMETGHLEPAEMDYAQHNATYGGFLWWSKLVIAGAVVVLLGLAIFAV